MAKNDVTTMVRGKARRSSASTPDVEPPKQVQIKISHLLHALRYIDRHGGDMNAIIGATGQQWMLTVHPDFVAALTQAVKSAPTKPKLDVIHPGDAGNA